LSELSVSDLRVLIGQDIGLDFLMPLALDVVEREPLIKAEHYRGDLLAVVLRAAPQFYQKNPKMKARVDTVLASLPSALEKLDFIEFDTSSEALEEASLLFRRGTP
jgi:hypothetical protein